MTNDNAMDLDTDAPPIGRDRTILNLQRTINLLRARESQQEIRVLMPLYQSIVATENEFGQCPIETVKNFIRDRIQELKNE